MTEIVGRIAPSVGIVALIGLWVFLMLVGGSYFHQFVPEVSGPAQWNTAVVRVGMTLLMAIIGALVAERQQLPLALQGWVGLSGGVIGFIGERLWRKVHRRIVRSGRRKTD